MTKTTIRALKAGDFFTLKDYGDEPNEARVYIRGEYDRSEKKYYAPKFSDSWGAGSWFKGSRVVYTDFIF